MSAKKDSQDGKITQKTEWVRKQDRIQFFTNDVSNTDYFECMKASARSLKEKTAFDGWLTKQGGKGLGVNWRRRWFILTYDKYLYYYKNPDDDGPLGVICLDNYEAVSMPVEDNKKKYRFSIHNNNKSTIRVFHVYADTLQESLQWVSTIDQVFKAPKLDNTKTKIINRDIERESNLGIRRDARLYIRIVEARKLQKTTSCYCIVDMDSQQVRTQTIWKTKEPMWSEEFYLDVYGDIEQIWVVVTCWKMQKAGKGAALGKIELPLSTLSDQKQHDQWYPLVPADSDKYIAGEVHLKIEYKSNHPNHEEGTLFVQVVGAKNLAPKGIGGTSNPFIRLILGKKKKKTKTIQRTLDPSFNDFFEFKINNVNNNNAADKELVLVVYHRDKLVNQFLGKVSISYTELEPNFLYDIWYTLTNEDDQVEDIDHDLDEEDVKEEIEEKEEKKEIEVKEAEVPTQTVVKKERPNWVASHRANTSINLSEISQTPVNPLSLSAPISPSSSQGGFNSLRPKKLSNPVVRNETLRGSNANTNSTSKKLIGDIRVVLKYTQQMVLPVSEYEELYELLLENNFEVIHLLGAVTNEKEDVGRSLSCIFESRGKAVELISSLNNREIENTPNADVIFRANTIATKTLDYYMKLIGLPFLHKTLSPVIEEIYKEKKLCEVDPSRLDNKLDDIPKNFAALLAYVEEVTNVIFNSDCPHKLRRIFHNLQEKVKSQYPDDQIQIVKYTSVSGFIFLRFFCAAILGPKLFDLMKEHPEMRIARTLTLVAKTLQNLSNLCEFGYKEMYMAEMNKFIVDKMNNVKEYIDSISTLPDVPRREDAPAIDFGREMATIHQHLANNLKAIQELEKTVTTQKLAAVLRRLDTVKERYELEL